jgi:hypothetical protein
VRNHINLKNHTEQLTNSLGQVTNTEVNKGWLYFSNRNMCYNIQYIRITVYNETNRKYKLLQNHFIGGPIPYTTSTRTGSMLYLPDITP